MPRLVLLFCHAGQINAEIMTPYQTSAPLPADIAYHADVRLSKPGHTKSPQGERSLESSHLHGAHQAQHICRSHSVCCGLVQFDKEISKDLRPRLERTGDADLLQPFLDYFSGRSFQSSTSLLALWEGA